MSKTEEIFKTNGCPFKNHSQGNSLKVVFVCSAGMLRSPTAARIAGEYGINARSAGSHTPVALIPLSANLIHWADKIVFMNPSNQSETYYRFRDQELFDQLDEKSVCWDVEDVYNYMDDSLVWKIEKLIELTFNVRKE